MSANSVRSSEHGLAHTLIPISDRRASPRIRTVCFTVKVDHGGAAGLFRARNISDTGMMLETHVPLDVGEPVLINLSEDIAIQGTVLWQDEHRCGVRFKQAIDSAILLKAEAERKRTDRRGGALRLTASRLAASFSEKGIRAVKIVDVSHRGVGLTHDGTLEAGMLFKLAIDSEIQRIGEVRWSEDGLAGIRLTEALNCKEVGHICGLDQFANLRMPTPVVLRKSS